MDDYISREAAIKILEYARDAMGQESAFGAGYAAGLDVARNHIIDLPAADVRPVVYAEWNKINQETTGLPWKCRCNNCGCPQDYAHNFCPNYGARMDGGSNDA